MPFITALYGLFPLYHAIETVRFRGLLVIIEAKYYFSLSLMESFDDRGYKEGIYLHFLHLGAICTILRQ